MTLVLDANAVIALHVATDPHHERAVTFAQRLDDDLVTTPLVLAEVDYVIGRRGGLRARQVVWENFEDRAYLLRWWADGAGESIAIARRHPELDLADASLVALADRERLDRIFTFDTHFRDLVTPRGAMLQMLP